MIDTIKEKLYHLLGLHKYLLLLQQVFKIEYNLGLLKGDEKYRWHYFVKKLISPNDTVIDIGANLGYFSYIFSGIIEEQGRLYCVEPVAPYRKLLNRLIPHQENIVIYPYALGEQNQGTVKLGMPSFLRHLRYLRHGTVTILKDDEIAGDQLIFESEARRGSELFASLEKIDYIKCDIEGYETVVFPEMKPILEKYRPVVQLETWMDKYPSMASFFRELGYSIFTLRNGNLMPASLFADEEVAAADVLFVPEEKTAKFSNLIKST